MCRRRDAAARFMNRKPPFAFRSSLLASSRWHNSVILSGSEESLYFRKYSNHFLRTPNPISLFDDRRDQSGNGVLLGFDVHGQSELTQRGGGYGTDGCRMHAMVVHRLLQGGTRTPQSQQRHEVLHGRGTGEGDSVRPERLVGQQGT